MQALIDTCHAYPASRGHLCACLDAHGLERLRAFAADLQISSGNVVFKQGDGADCLFGVRSGTIMLSKTLRDDRRQVLSFLFPGDLFGFAADNHHACRAEALERTSLCRIPLSAVADSPPLRRRLLDCARSAGEAAIDHLLRVGRMTARERCAFFLVSLWRATGKRADVFLSMRTADIADYLGLQPETVSRQFTILRQDGMISAISADHFLQIKDISGLVAVAGESA